MISLSFYVSLSFFCFTMFHYLWSLSFSSVTFKICFTDVQFDYEILWCGLCIYIDTLWDYWVPWIYGFIGLVNFNIFLAIISSNIFSASVFIYEMEIVTVYIFYKVVIEGIQSLPVECHIMNCIKLAVLRLERDTIFSSFIEI